jgi:hypothetical protein
MAANATGLTTRQKIFQWSAVLFPILLSIPVQMFAFFILMMSFDAPGSEGKYLAGVIEILLFVGVALVPVCGILGFFFNLKQKAKIARFISFIPLFWPILVFLIRFAPLY